MRFRAHLVRVAVAGVPIVACTDGKSDAPAKVDAKPDAKPDADTKTGSTTKPVEPKPTIVVRTPEDIPVALGGAPMPYTEPPKPIGGKGDGGTARSPAPAPAPAAPAAAAPEPVGAIGAAAEAPPPALAIGHHHAPGEPCTPLARAEVEKALADLRR